MPDTEECFHTIVSEAGKDGGMKGWRREAGKKKRQKEEEEKNTEVVLGLPSSFRPFKESVFLKDQKKEREKKTRPGFYKKVPVRSQNFSQR